MRTAHAPLKIAAVDAALRQLPPNAERHLRRRFGIGTRAAPSIAAREVADRRRRRQLETAAFRRLRRQAVQAPA